MWWKKIKIIVALAAISFTGTAQQRVSLQELIEMALEHNYQVQILRNRQQIAENQNTLGNAGFLPALRAGADRVWGVQNTEQRFFNGDVRSGDNARSARREAYVELDWTLFDGFSMFASRNRLQHLQQIGQADTRYFIHQTIADISDLYYQMVTELQLLESLRKTLEVSNFRLKLEEQKRNVGTGNSLLFQQALIDFNSDSILLLEQQRQIAEIRIRINTIINQEPDYPIVPLDSSVGLYGIRDTDTIVEKIIMSNAQLELSQLQELVAESNLRIERAGYYPVLSVFGNYSYAGQNNEVGFIETSTQYGLQYGLRVRFNLYEGGRQRMRVRNAALEQQIASVMVDDTRSLLNSHLATLINAYDSYIMQLRISQSSLQAAQNSLTIAREQLAEGMISGFDFRQAQLASLRVENQIARILFAMKSIETSIQRLTGFPDL